VSERDREPAVRGNVGAYRPFDDGDLPPLDIAEGLRRCYEILNRLDGSSELSDLPASTTANVCDVVTRAEEMRCGQCLSKVSRLYLYADVLVICAKCARSRIAAGRKLEAERRAA
jgi:hypothetical protein